MVGRWSLSHVARGTSHVAGAAGAAGAAGGACAAGAAGAAGAAAGAGGAGGCGGAGEGGEGGEGIFMYTHTSMQIMKYDYASTKEHQSISA